MGYGWGAIADMFAWGMHVGTVGFSTGVEFLDVVAHHGCAFVDAFESGLSVGSSQVVAGDDYTLRGA